MKKAKINSKVKDGNLAVNRSLISKTIKHFEGSEIILTIEKKFTKRSNNQNSFYWVVLIPIIAELLYDSTGHFFSEEETHDVLKSNCNYKEIVSESTGEFTKIPLSTTELTTLEFMQYIEKVEHFVFNYFNVTLPKPNEQLNLEL
mgnify:CR=1 FL=1